MELEKEFELYKTKHKDKFILQMGINYYEDLERNQINIPYFMRSDADRPRRKAEEQLYRIKQDKEKYESLYEKAYQILAPKLSGYQA